MELAFDEAQHQAGLPHCRFPQQHQLELADLVARRRAVGPRCSASPSHSTVLEMGRKEPGEEGGIWSTGGLEARCGGWWGLGEAEHEGRRFSLGKQMGGRERSSHQWELENKTHLFIFMPNNKLKCSLTLNFDAKLLFLHVDTKIFIARGAALQENSWSYNHV